MLVWILIIALTLSVALLILSLFFLAKFIKIIMVFEDDLSDTIEALNNVEDNIEQVLQMEIFFDSPDVRNEVNKILEEVKICRITINKMIQRFTARSKQQYYFLEEEEQTNKIQIVPRLPGQPPNTPNPLQMLHNEGIILDVRHQNQK